MAGEKAAADRKREELRIAAVEREYAAKLDDLRHNYALRVTIDWAQGLTLYAPVHRDALLIKRRKGERIVHIDWHPHCASSNRRRATGDLASGWRAGSATTICI